MLKLKNVSQENIVLADLYEKLLKPDEIILLIEDWRIRASNSSEIFDYIIHGQIILINHDDEIISNISDAIDALKCVQQKYLQRFDEKTLVQESCRPIDTFPSFCGEGDDPENIRAVNGGERMINSHNIGDDMTKSIYVNFNVKQNRTFFHEGYIMWKNADMDQVILDAVPVVTNYSVGSNTYFNIDPATGLIIPAAGDGNIVVEPEDMRLMEISMNIDHPDMKVMPGFWDADYDADTNTFFNITPNANGTGDYNMFSTEIILERVANINLLGDGFMAMQSADIAEFMHNMRFKLTFITEPPDHEWKMSCIITMHRRYTKTFG